MDANRLRSYLQVACASLGMDVGEVWRTSNLDQEGTGLATIEQSEEHNALVESGKKPRFVQLYTSRSFENKRNQLVTPADDEENERAQANGSSTKEENEIARKQHVLSPLLVDAISKTAQVVWAHTRKQEGLLGRSDMRFQTAVGIPVAVDGSGNMCVVVMFSSNNIQSTDDAMEYLQTITQSATSTSIPSLLPAFDPKQGLMPLPHHHDTKEMIPLLSSPALSDGQVVTRFVSLSDKPPGSEPLEHAEVPSEHSLANAPKDCFGIPMLPTEALLEGSSNSRLPTGQVGADAFDEASYGVWSTIMDNMGQPKSAEGPMEVDNPDNDEPLEMEKTAPVFATNKPMMAAERKDRLEEFASAFLDVSVFDFAEVWVPIGSQTDYLGQVTSVFSSDSESNQALHEFKDASENVLVKHWSGAVGRAFSSGNPVWSVNQNVFVDGGRSALFSKLKLETALAVPVFSGKASTPSFVFCCYSFVQSGSIPFVLKFAQQALRLLWEGLEKVQPHESVGENLWKDVAAADLGEMAADVEMQQHFLKKRPRESMESAQHEVDTSERSEGGAVRSIYTGAQSSPTMGSTPGADPEPTPVFAMQYPVVETVQTQVHQAGHHHLYTEADGSKRAHIYHEPLASTTEFADSKAGPSTQPPEMSTSQVMEAPAPLPMPRPLPLPNAILVQVSSGLLPPQHQPGQQQNGQERQHTPTNVDYPSQQHHTHVSYMTTDDFPSVGYTHHPHVVQAPQQQLFQQQAANEPTDETGFAPQQPQQQSAEQHQGAYPPQMPLHSGEPLSMPQSFQQPAHTVQQSSAPAGPLPTPVASARTESAESPAMTFDTSQPNQQPLLNGMSGPLPVAMNGMQMFPNVQYCIVANQGGETVAAVATNAKPCRIQGCSEPAAQRRPYCVRHSGNRMCEHEGCAKCAQGATRFCIAHGGGRRCTFPGCVKGARDKLFCAAHGGGKRCKFEGCNKSAVGGSNLCTAHGGGKRCSVPGCDKSAQSSTKFCVKHGGGKKCSREGCTRVARGRTQFCAGHGGGVRCKLAGCNRVAIGKQQLCRTHGGGTVPRRTTSPSEAGQV